MAVPFIAFFFTMPLHLIKLCVGCDDVESLQDWQRRRLAQSKKKPGKKVFLTHRTRAMPKRREEIVGEGSLYWVIKGIVQVRQPILDLVPVMDKDGTPMCEIRMAPRLIRTELVPHRAFQGWRYLEAADAPADLPKGVKGNLPPPEMAAELRALGLL